jgi:parallel beta-helix repeat protein
MTHGTTKLVRGLAVVGFILAMILTAGPALAAVLTVDDDGAQCPAAAFTDIQSAVDAASPGDTIRVCPGLYGPTNVDTSLTLIGFVRRTSPATCVTPPRPVNLTVDTVVDGADGDPAFDVTASNVTIQNFLVRNTTNHAGINLAASQSGYVIRDNIIRDNTFGIYFNSNGAVPSTISGNCIRDNNQPGAAAGNGIYSDQGVSNADIVSNIFRGHGNTALILTSVPPGPFPNDILIDRNTVQQDSQVMVVNAENVQITRNTINESTANGVEVDGSSNVEVSLNRITGCAFTAIQVRTIFAAGPSHDNTVSRNIIVGCGNRGIALRAGAHDNTVADNRVEANGFDPAAADFDDGIYLENAVDNTILRNLAIDNHGDGLRAEATATGNDLLTNRASGNGAHDCHDNSGAAPPAPGPGNTWTGNTGLTQNREGLCRNAAVLPPPLEP